VEEPEIPPGVRDAIRELLRWFAAAEAATDIDEAPGDP
jgi:hypothetical protein